MNAHTNNHTVIYQDDAPVFVVVPYADYKKMTQDDDIAIPNEVVQIVLRKDCNLVGAWRRFRKLTQAELAAKMGVTQSAISQLEQADNPRSHTLQLAAKALNCSLKQLSD